MNSILLTGATGFLGRHMLRRLRTSGANVEAISLHGGWVDGVEIAAVDVSSRTKFFNWAQGREFDTIVHMASVIPSSVSALETEQLFHSNVQGVLNVLALVRERGCPAVYTSSSSVYGTSASVPLEETALPRPENLYACSKYVGEILCEQATMTQKARIATLRISAPYGPGSWRPTVVNIFLQAALSSSELTLLGSGNRTQDFIFVSDVIDAVELAIRSQASGILNVASGQPVTMKRLAETVLEALPESRSRIVCRDVPDPQEDYRPRFIIEKARRELGWRPQMPLLTGLKTTVQALYEATA